MIFFVATGNRYQKFVRLATVVPTQLHGSWNVQQKMSVLCCCACFSCFLFRLNANFLILFLITQSRWSELDKATQNQCHILDAFGLGVFLIFWSPREIIPESCGISRENYIFMISFQIVYYETIISLLFL